MVLFHRRGHTNTPCSMNVVFLTIASSGCSSNPSVRNALSIAINREDPPVTPNKSVIASDASELLLTPHLDNAILKGYTLHTCSCQFGHFSLNSCVMHIGTTIEAESYTCLTTKRTRMYVHPSTCR